MYIQITEQGWEYLKKTVGDDYINHCVKDEGYKIDGEIWYKLQCHTVFDIFPVNIGFEPYFNTNVLFDNESLEEFPVGNSDDYFYYPENEGTAKTFRNISDNKWYYENELTGMLGVELVNTVKHRFGELPTHA